MSGSPAKSLSSYLSRWLGIFMLMCHISRKLARHRLILCFLRILCNRHAEDRQLPLKKLLWDKKKHVHLTPYQKISFWATFWGSIGRHLSILEFLELFSQIFLCFPKKLKNIICKVIEWTCFHPQIIKSFWRGYCRLLRV